MEKYKTLNAFYAAQNGDKKAQVEALRAILLDADPALYEILKWNAPNFVHQGNDRLTMNLMNKEGKVKLILHMGATKKENKKGDPVMVDDTGLVVWNSDIRGTIAFESATQIEQSRAELIGLVRNWLAIPV